jgi:hypothetical protein
MRLLRLTARNGVMRVLSELFIKTISYNLQKEGKTLWKKLLKAK